MPIFEDPWTSPAAPAIGRRLVRVDAQLLTALAAGDHRTAASLTPWALSPYVTDNDTWLWKLRRDQITRYPADAAWVTRLLIDETSGTAVGHAGFHGRPDAQGMVEIGYAVDPGHRRRGHARAALTILLDVASARPDVRTVRASIRPDNEPSRALIDQYGFVVTGEQWDAEDGLEIILERPARWS